MYIIYIPLYVLHSTRLYAAHGALTYTKVRGTSSASPILPGTGYRAYSFCYRVIGRIPVTAPSGAISHLRPHIKFRTSEVSYETAESR